MDQKLLYVKLPLNLFLSSIPPLQARILSSIMLCQKLVTHSTPQCLTSATSKQQNLTIRLSTELSCHKNIHSMNRVLTTYILHSCLLLLPTFVMTTSCCKSEIDVTPLLPHDMHHFSLPGRQQLLSRCSSSTSSLYFVTSAGHWSTLLRHFCPTFHRHFGSKCFKF